ncbi:MAG: VaFE repeat-containing surface-anchored protein [Ruminococcus sp.]|nr:VaFE repeat-containing surface-anchored protein [Ruminococcus sp.]
MNRKTYQRVLSGFLACVMAVLSAVSVSGLFSGESKAAEPGTIHLEIGERVEYSGYSTNLFYLNGNLTYCLEPAKSTPMYGDYAYDVLANNELLAKALYYVEGAPGAEELGEGFWQMPNPEIWGVSPFGERYAYCHMFLAWIYSGYDFNAAFAGTNLTSDPDLIAALKSDFEYRKTVIEKKTVPDASLVITPEVGKATWKMVNGKLIQQTPDFTLQGDSRNSDTIPAPTGTTIYNKETGQSGSSITVKGGQHFYMTADANTSGTYTSSEIAGAMRNQWRSIIFNKNSSSQTMGGWSYARDPVDPVTFKVQWADRGQIRIKKESSNPSATHDGVDDDQYTLQGARFGIFQGDPANGGTLMEEVITDANGEATSNQLPAPFTYYVKELSPSKGYLVNTNSYKVNTIADQTQTVTVKETPQLGKIILHKRNARTSDTNVYGGKYSLKGAIYDIKNSKGQVLLPMTTDQNGDAVSSLLACGTYTVQERTPPIGFLKDPTEYTVTITSTDTVTEVFTREVTSLEKEQKGKITIQKMDSETGEAEPQGSASLKNAIYDVFKVADYKENDSTTSLSYVCSATTNEKGIAETPELFLDDYYVIERTPSAGYLLDKTRYKVSLTSENRTDAIFTKSVTSKEDVIRGDVQLAKFASTLDGEDELELMNPLEGIKFSFKSLTTNKVVCTITTDKYGFASTKDEKYPRGRLPYDTYEVTETNTPAGFKVIKPFIVTISEEGATLGYIVENDHIVSGVSVMKKDADTGDTVPQAGTEFRLLNQKKEPITMKTHYPKNETHKTFFTDERGSFIFPERLAAGIYYLEEVNAPEGMLRGELLKFEVAEGGTWEEPLIVEYYNKNVKGQITLKKTDSDTKHPVPEAVYGLYAAKDIITADTTIRAQKGDLVAKGTTNEKGEIVYENLYLGDYYLKEITPAPGYTLDETKYPVTLEYIDQETPLVKETVKVKNTPTKVNILKVDEETNVPLEGAVFEVWREDIKGEDGNPIKTEYTTELDGIIELLYLNPGTYSVQEKIPPVGYGRNDMVYEFTVGIDGLVKRQNSYAIIVKDRKSKIQTTAEDKATGTNQAVTAKETTIIDTVAYEGLTPGKEYTLKGILMNRDTKEILLINGKEVTAELTFTPEKSSGKVDMEFTFDGSKLQGKSIVVFERLYLDGVEVAVHADIKDKGQTIEFPEHKIQTTAKDKATDSHQAIAVKEITVVDTVSYEGLIPGQEYTLKGVLMERTTVEDSKKEAEKETGKQTEQEAEKELGRELLIDGKPVTAEVTFTPEKPNGEIDMEFTFDASKLQGKSIVIFERLYQDGTEVAAHADINDKGQTVEFPKHSIKTQARGKHTNSHEVSPEEKTVLIDTVSYEGLLPSMEYVVKGIVMEKETGEPFLNDGKEVLAATIFTPEETEGTVEVEFTLNTEGLEGKELVIFEKLYAIAKKGNTHEVASHEDIKDKGQTIKVVQEPKIIKTGDSADTRKIALLIGLATASSIAGFSAWKKKKGKNERKKRKFKKQKTRKK